MKAIEVKPDPTCPGRFFATFSSSKPFLYLFCSSNNPETVRENIEKRLRENRIGGR